MAQHRRRIFQDLLTESFREYGPRIALDCGNKKITYSQLEKNANAVTHRITRENIKTGSFIGICLDDRIGLISVMIGILKAGCVFVILDTLLPPDRIKRMIRLTHMQFLFLDPQNKKKLFDNDNNNNNDIEKNIKTYRVDGSFFREGDALSITGDTGEYDREDKIYIYFTSGSTGTPKAILGKNKSLLHFIDWEIDTFGIDGTYRISQLTAPGFDAFLRDVFTPLCAGAAVCIPPHKNISMESRELIRWIDERQIGLIHCVPSTFRVFNRESLVPGNFKSLKYVLLSGEKIPPQDLKNWFNVFGERIQLVNLYGPTETTMIKTCYFIREPDCRKARIPAGKPIKGTRIFILDKNMNMCGKEFTGEIYIRTPYMTAGYYDDPETNREKFIPNPFTRNPNDLFYKTGDLGRVLDDDERNIEVVGRMDRQVKIRGIRIEPEEIENTLSAHDAVDEAVVIDREDSKGDCYLCAYIVSKGVDLTELKQCLSQTLPDNMVPSYFIEIDKIPLTPNGKVDRNALPPPRLKRGEDYTPPGNEMEEKMVEIWSEVLGVEKDVIGMESNFFELGGHSLKATAMIEKVHKELKAKLPLAEVFKNPCIRALCEYIGINNPAKSNYAPIEPVEKKEYDDLSSAQKRLYILQQMDLNSTAYNMSRVFPLPEEPDIRGLERTFSRLIQRHESFRTSFETVEDHAVQRVHDRVEFKIEYLKDEIHQPVRFVRPFDLSRAPLLRVGLIKEQGNHILMVDMHHIISDGLSYGTLIKDFTAFYRGVDLPPLKLQYKDFSQWQNSETQKEHLKQQEAYWLKQFEKRVPPLKLPLDYDYPAGPGAMDFKADILLFEIDPAETKRLREITLAEGATMFMILLSAYYVLLSRLGGEKDIAVGTAIAGRRHTDLEKIIGMFVNTLVLRNYPENPKTFREFLRQVKQRTIQAFDNQDYPFENLVEKVAGKRDTRHNPLFNVMFELQTLAVDRAPNKHENNYDYIRRTSKFDLLFYAVDAGHQVFFRAEYSTGLFKEETIRRYIDYYKEILSFVLRDRNIKLEEIKISYDLVEKALKNPQIDFGF